MYSIGGMCSQGKWADVNCTYNIIAHTDSKASNTYYDVANGPIPGIYTTWNQCCKQTNEYPESCHGSFSTLKENILFMSTNGRRWG